MQLERLFETACLRTQATEVYPYGWVLTRTESGCMDEGHGKQLRPAPTQLQRGWLSMRSCKDKLHGYKASELCPSNRGVLHRGLRAAVEANAVCVVGAQLSNGP